VWNLPVGHDRHYLAGASRMVDALIGGWQVAVLSTLAAGDAVTLTYTPAVLGQVSGITADFRGANNYRPDVVGNLYGDTGSLTSYLNKSAVQIPSVSSPFGDAGRNSVRGPKFWQVDMAIQKAFQLPLGRTALQFRAEAFNVLNRTNFGAPNGNASSSAFGTITGTYDPRQVQVGVRVTF
jgi:hypothetical protein